MDAISHSICGTMEHPINDSKGCGGMMRVAPIGLYLPDNEIIALVHMISLAAHREGLSLPKIVDDMKRAISLQFSANVFLPDFLQLIEKVEFLSGQDVKDEEAIRKLSEGWVAEETLAIAVYCALKYHNDFDKALIASVNHSGDSDSTGSVTGNILGVYLGLEAIPSKYTNHLEIIDVITEIADDLYNDCRISEYESSPDGIWEKKYIYNSYTPHKCCRSEK